MTAPDLRIVGSPSAADIDPSASFFLIVADYDQGFFCVEGQSGTCVRLTVGDTGTGMDRATLARVMEPFFTTKAQGQGTGLGLPMARGFAERAGTHDADTWNRRQQLAERALPVPFRQTRSTSRIRALVSFN
jgi:hypothetical protein